MEANRNEDINLRELLSMLLSQWKLFIVTTFLTLAAATIYYIKTQRVYEMRSLVIIDDEETTTDPTDILFETGFSDVGQRISNEMIMLKAFPLVKKTIKDLGIDVQYYRKTPLRSYEIYTKSPIKVDFKRGAVAGAFENEFDVTILNDHSYKIESDVYLEKLEKTIELSEELNFGETYKNEHFSFKIDLRDSVDTENMEPLYFIPFDINELSSTIGTELAIGLMQDESSIISLSMEGSTPLKWIDFMDRLIDNHVAFSLQDKNLISQNTIEFIEKEHSRISDTLELISNKLKDLRSEGSKVQSSEGLSKVGQQILDLEVQLSNTELKQSYFESLFGNVESDQPENLLSPGILGVADPVLSALMTEYVSLKRNLELLEASNQTASPNYEQIKFRTASVKSELLKNLNNIKETTDAKMESLENQISELEKSYEGYPALERQMIELNRDYKLNEQLYLLLSEKKTEAEITRSSNVSDIRVVERTRMTSSEPIAPSQLVFPIALLVGLAIAFLSALGLKLMDNKIQEKEDLKEIGELSYLGEIDQIKETSDYNEINTKPKSSLAESFRIIRQNLSFFSKRKDASTFLVTSYIPGEGKTFVSTRLSMIYGQTSKKVVLIDCDLRRSRVHKELQKPLGEGLSSYLAEQAELSDIIQELPELGISLVTAGPPPPNPMELLLTDRMERLVNQLKEEYDYVILDAPPLSIISDSFVLEKYISSTILVCRSGHTPKEAIGFYQDKIKEGQIVKPAFVLNGVKKSSRSSYGYKYAYYEDRRPLWKRLLSRKS